MFTVVRALLLLCLLAALACSGPTAPPRANVPAAANAASGEQPAHPSKITASYSTLSGSQMPIYLAAEQGLFARHGLDVETVYIASGTTAMQSLIAGDVQFSA